MQTLVEVVRWLESAPDGTTLSARAMLALVRDLTPEPTPVQLVPSPAAAPSWRERIWTVPADTRMTALDVADACGGRPKSWVYRHTSQASGLPRIPHRKLDGELVFVAGEVRDWIRAHEDVVVHAPKVAPTGRRAIGGLTR